MSAEVDHNCEPSLAPDTLDEVEAAEIAAHQETLLTLEEQQRKHEHGIVTADTDTSAMIAEATAAAISAAVEEVDVDAVAALVDATDVPVEADDTARKNEQRRKRYRERALEGETKKKGSHEEQLAFRRDKDRQRYSKMTPEQRRAYNEKRREQYHKQTEESRKRRREREKSRYHALDNESAKDRNSRRAKLERERYQKLNQEELDSKNRRRRERAALARRQKQEEKAAEEAALAAAAEAAQQQAEADAAVETVDNTIGKPKEEEEPLAVENPPQLEL